MLTTILTQQPHDGQFLTKSARHRVQRKLIDGTEVNKCRSMHLGHWRMYPTLNSKGRVDIPDYAFDEITRIW
jgi:hypothetical protein